METAITLIQGLGFPIACCLALGLAVKYLFDVFIKKVDGIEELHKQETDKLADAVNNNTSVMREMLERLKEG